MTSKKYSSENSRHKAVIICGPTCSGKSSLGMEIAGRIGGSIISADSRQIYRRLDIGTAKPSTEDLKEIPHYMIDVADVREDYTAVRFAREAVKNFELIVSQDRIPVVVGGAGLYIEALTRGIFIGPGKDARLREELESAARDRGSEALHQELCDADPETAAGISKSDKVRIIRALEIFRQSGVAPSRLRRDGNYLKADADFCWIGLDLPREMLYERINRRVDQMVKNGLIGEIEALLKDDLGDSIVRKKIVGYYEIIEALQKNESLGKALDLVKQHTRNYAKRQMTWFRNRTNPVWLNPDGLDFKDKVFTLLDEYL